MMKVQTFQFHKNKIKVLHKTRMTLVRKMYQNKYSNLKQYLQIMKPLLRKKDWTEM